jgi:hypothetical protein
MLSLCFLSELNLDVVFSVQAGDKTTRGAGYTIISLSYEVA